MTPEEINRTIEDCLGGQRYGLKKRGLWYRPNAKGYTNRHQDAWAIPLEEARKHEYKFGDASEQVDIVPIPPLDFYNDLNACHEMESMILSSKTFDFICMWLDNLYRARGLNPWVWRNGTKNTPPMEMAGVVSATAPQRCEAFLRTIGKWKEEEQQ